MDSSKLGWRAPTDQCLDEIAARWPGRVQVVVDACQMRLGRPRLRKYLGRGYIVIITGSKFFTGPAFSGALLVPARLSQPLDAVGKVPSGLREYSSRSDWPSNWSLRSRFPFRANFGLWLRWEAALEEIRAYYAVPDEFRHLALTTFAEGVARIIEASPSLGLLPLPQTCDDGGGDDEELAVATIFPFVIRHGDRIRSTDECRQIHRALAGTSWSAKTRERPHVAAPACLVGQPVALAGRPGAALRICAGARLVTETWSADETAARENLQRQLGDVGAVVSRIQWLATHIDDASLAEPGHEA
jgi:hypothetical protein